ncbi:glycine/betaine ABC transporter [Pueribacillus theae]|uniref:Glycine/betaine ABC transporter n=1 Tax=Pueribacillus theae TaxID=2171751 RepID=A0A2U1K3V5_9BACI|nr:glycine betaine ABC transporter substrate-binding protein [Pueribacillus theae]PWA12092.1 glycine/betaine ABC transporter [Pueribacillus theae]
MRKNILLAFLFLVSIFLLASCGGNQQENDAGGGGNGETNKENKGKVSIGLNNWAENVAVSNLWKVLLEDKGYEVELSSMEKAPVWTGIAQGDLDIAPEVWLPITDEPLYEEYKDDIELGETWYEGTGLGLAVPEYMDIASIEELNDKKSEFKLEKIVGIDAGASLMGLTRNAIDEYSLDYDLIESSETAMLSELDKAYQNKEPIVVTMWNPHWAFSEYKIKYLEDPKKVYGEADDIYFMTRKGFKDDFPEVVEWMNNWKMDDDSLGELMAIGQEKEDPIAAAKEWIKKNQDLVNEWMK